jgi:peptidyl-prolyl cis-trans isomerase D
MQIIQQIREKGAAIVIVVIVLSLIGFILMDANLGMNRSAAGSRESLGKVNGKTIEGKDFDAKVKAIEEQYGGRVSGTQVNMIRQNAWDQLVFEKVAETEFDKLGITFTPKELTAIMFSDDAPQSLKQAFTDKETGQYDLAKVQQWWANAKKSKGEQKDAVETQVIEPMKLQAMYNKYSGMIAASAYYPTWMKDKEAAEAKTFANISYVAVPYSTISDSTVKVSDEDIVNYISKRKATYKQEGGRQIAYVGFSSNPSGADTAAALEGVTSLAAAFAADTNAQVFLSRNASAKEYENAYLPKSKLPAAQKDTLASLAQGAVYGPYFDGKDYVLAKKIKTRMLGDSIKCRHILIGTTDRETGQQLLSDSAAKSRVDSVELAIKSGAGFDEMEAKYSTDVAAHKDKGVMTFDIATVQNPTGFAPEFAEFLLNEKGETRKVVKTNFGWHYIEMMQIINPAPAYNIAYMAKEVSPSEETIRVANGNANNLAAAAKNLKAFDDYVAKNKLQKIDNPTLVKENDYSVGALQDARQLVRWANESKEGDVSEPFTIGDQFVVGVLTKVVPEGLPDAKTARPMVEAQVRNQKKAEQIKTKLAATSTLELAAAAYPGLQVATAGADSTLVFSASIINGLGAEPKVIGASFDKAYQAKASAPIEGTNGVYVIKVNSVGTKNVDAPAVDKAKTMAQQLSYGWFEALKKLADVKDERSKVF